eukprot:snap_masked-scaffold_8-processed-gene-14.76-mRNA-1 protein AED:1.00 eAED:1.00 QI:0/0/0/0/1/1/2/0/1064
MPVLQREKKKELEEREAERIRREQEEEDDEQEELFGADSSEDEGGEQEEGRTDELSDEKRAALRKSLHLPLADEAEDSAENSGAENLAARAETEAENNSQEAAQVAAAEKTKSKANRVATGAPGQDDPKPDAVAETMLLSESESEAENLAAGEEDEAGNLVAEAEDEAENEVAATEDRAERIFAAAEKEADILDLTQPMTATKEVEPTSPTAALEDEAASSDGALNIDEPTTLERVIAKGRNKKAGAEAVNLTSPPSAKKSKKKAAPSAPRQKRVSRKQCEFYLKEPRWFTPKKYVVCEEDLREMQSRMRGKTAVELLEEKNIHKSSRYPLLLMTALSEKELHGVPISARVAHMLAAVPNFRESQEVSFGQLVGQRKKSPAQVLKYNTPTWFFRSTEGLITTAVQFMADRGMAVVRGNMPKPNLSANDDPDRPRRITPFRWVMRAEPAAEIVMRTPIRKVRPSEHTRTDVENRLQKRIDTLTTANERIKAQSLAAESVLRDRNSTIMRKAVNEERKKNKAEIKRMAKELREMKSLYRAEVEKVRELQRSAIEQESAFGPTPQTPPTPKSTPAHGRTLSDFAETRSLAEATQESVFTLSAKMSGMESLLAKLTEVTAQALKRPKDTDEVAEIQRQRAEDARRDRVWRSYGGKFRTLKAPKVKDIRAMLDMRDAYLDVYGGEKEPNLWIHVDPELKQSLSSSGVTKEGLVEYLRKYMSEHEAYEGEDTLRTIAEKVAWPSEGPFLERLNTYMSSATGCIKWKQLKENAQKFEVLKALNKRLPVELQMRDARLKVKLDAPKSKFGDSLNKFRDLIKSVYERRMDTTEEVDLSPPEPTVTAPRESEVRRTQQRAHRSGRKRRQSISSDKERGRNGNKYYRRKSRSPSPRGYRRSTNRGRYFPHRNRGGYENRRYERNEDRKSKQRDSFLALPAPGDEYKKRNPTRRINVSVRRAEKKDVTIHHVRSGDRISDAILDSGADESVASLHKHAWMMDVIEDVKERITIADGTTDLRITKIGYADLELRIGGVWKCDFRKMKIFLVDDKKWKELLVGAPALEKAGLMPHQNV